MMRLFPTALPMLALTLAAMPAAAHQDELPGNTKQCISLNAIRGETAENEERLIFHMGGSKAYISHLPQSCNGLRSINNVGHLKLDPRGDRLCVGDSVLLRDNAAISAVGLADKEAPTRCTLGPFEPVTEMTLTEALRLP